MPSLNKYMLPPVFGRKLITLQEPRPACAALTDSCRLCINTPAGGSQCQLDSARKQNPFFSLWDSGQWG